MTVCYTYLVTWYSHCRCKTSLIVEPTPRHSLQAAVSNGMLQDLLLPLMQPMSLKAFSASKLREPEHSDILLQATKDVLAMASLEVDLSKIEAGNTITVKWRGKPVFIKRRTEEDIENANNVDLKTLRDPQPDSDRVQNPEVISPWSNPFYDLAIGDLPLTSYSSL